MIKIYKKIGITALELRYMAIAIACSLLCLFSYKSFLFSLSVVIIQVSYILYLLVVKRTIDAVVTYTIFLCMSLEFFYTAGDFYGLKSFRIFGISVAVCLIFILALFTVIDIGKKRQPTFYDIKKCVQVRKVKNTIIILNAVAIIIGFLMFLMGNNGILHTSDYIKAFAIELYTLITLVTLPTWIISHFLIYEEFRVKIRKAIIAILVALVFQQYVSIFTGITGYILGQRVPLASSVQIYVPFLILFLFKEDESHKTLFFIIGLLGLLISFKYSMGSGQYIVLFSVPIWFLLVAIKSKKRIVYAGITVGAIALVMAVICIVKFGMLNHFSVSVQFKLDDAISFLNVRRENWRELLPMSARVRVEEFIDIIIEYFHFPILCLFGKGIMGTVHDSTGFFAASQWALGTSAYSQLEWNSGLYYSMHETINKLFLTNGLVGLFFIFKTGIRGLKNSIKSPYVAIGIMWLIWYWGYSTTLSWFGLTCLLVGMIEPENKVLGDVTTKQIVN